MNELNLTKTNLPAVYYEMIGFRMLGLTYEQIGQKTGYSEGWIKQLFMKDGALYSYWRDYVIEKKKLAVEQAADIEFAHLEDIVKANVLDAKLQGEMVGVIARKAIWDRTFGPVQQNVKLSGGIGVVHATFADWAEAMQKELDAEADKQKSTPVPT